MFGHEKAVAEMKELNSMGRSLVLAELFTAGKLDFPEVARTYIAQLEKDNHRLNGDIAILSLYLGMFLIDKPAGTKYMREFLFKRGYHKGSQYGDALEKEFTEDETTVTQ